MAGWLCLDKRIGQVGCVVTRETNRGRLPKGTLSVINTAKKAGLLSVAPPSKHGEGAVLCGYQAHRQGRVGQLAMGQGQVELKPHIAKQPHL